MLFSKVVVPSPRTRPPSHQLNGTASILRPYGMCSAYYARAGFEMARVDVCVCVCGERSQHLSQMVFFSLTASRRHESCADGFAARPHAYEYARHESCVDLITAMAAAAWEPLPFRTFIFMDHIASNGSCRTPGIWCGWPNRQWQCCNVACLT
jgi:hypothetical protein